MPYASLIPRRLKIKAAPASADAADATAHHAVLCTPWQTFSLRHVHSSNSTFLVAPNAAPTAPGISAVSTETSYLELVATSPDTTALLQKHLIAYHGWAADDGDGDVAMLNTASTPPDTSAAPDKYALRDNLPMSNQEFDTAWRKTMAFEYRNTFYRPLPAAILQAIDALLLAAAAEKMPLTAPFEFTRLSAAVIEDQPEVPVELLHAVLSQICDEVPTTNEMVLVPSRCASFVGRCVLEDYWWNQQAKRNMVRFHCGKSTTVLMGNSTICSTFLSWVGGKAKFPSLAQVYVSLIFSR